MHVRACVVCVCGFIHYLVALICKFKLYIPHLLHKYFSFFEKFNSACVATQVLFIPLSDWNLKRGFNWKPNHKLIVLLTLKTLIAAL